MSLYITVSGRYLEATIHIENDGSTSGAVAAAGAPAMSCCRQHCLPQAYSVPAHGAFDMHLATLGGKGNVGGGRVVRRRVPWGVSQPSR